MVLTKTVIIRAHITKGTVGWYNVFKDHLQARSDIREWYSSLPRRAGVIRSLPVLWAFNVQTKERSVFLFGVWFHWEEAPLLVWIGCTGLTASMISTGHMDYCLVRCCYDEIRTTLVWFKAYCLILLCLQYATNILVQTLRFLWLDLEEVSCGCHRRLNLAASAVGEAPCG